MLKTAATPTLLPGISSLIAQTNEQIRRAAGMDGTVFLTGEVGTEKAFAAKLIHQLSPRAHRPLSKISVSWKLPPDLAQYFQSCAGGSLLIHLQKEFPIDMQYTLVEMASHGCFADPMSGDVIESDVRIILMTSLDIEKLGGRTPLLPELKEVLSANHIEIPPLRSRSEDIPALVRYAIKRAHDTGRSPAQGADPQVLSLFRQWSWPGNAEDLLLVTAQAAISAKEDLITLNDLPESFTKQLAPEALEAARSVRISKSRPSRTSYGDPQRQSGSSVRLPSTESVRTAQATPVEEQTANLNEPTDGTPYAAKYDQELADTQGGQGGASSESSIPPDARMTPDTIGLPDEFLKTSPRILNLARRLNAQSSLLSRQMSGPLDPASSAELIDRLASEAGKDESLNVLEKELDRGLDMILRLRRQMAVLNLRQQQSAETIRDIVQRISQGGGDDVQMFSAGTDLAREAKDLADSLRAIDEIHRRVSTELPTAGIMLENTMQGNLADPRRDDNTPIFGRK